MEVSSRLWCGTAVGLVIGFAVWFTFCPWSIAWAGTVIGGITVACAVLAVPYGEDFWYWIRYVLWFLRV